MANQCAEIKMNWLSRLRLCELGCRGRGFGEEFGQARRAVGAEVFGNAFEFGQSGGGALFLKSVIERPSRGLDPAV